MVFPANRLLKLVDFGGKKFYRTAASGADHVVMAAPIVLMLIASDAVVECDFAGQSALGEQFESAIDRSHADPGIALTHELVKLFDGEMFMSFEKSEEDSVALLGPFQADTFQMLLKTILGLPQPLLRDRDGIIDAFLQHFRAFLA